VHFRPHTHFEKLLPIVCRVKPTYSSGPAVVSEVFRPKSGQAYRLFWTFTSWKAPQEWVVPGHCLPFIKAGLSISSSILQNYSLKIPREYTVKTKPRLENVILVSGVKPKLGWCVFWLFFKIGLCSAVSFQRSRRWLNIGRYWKITKIRTTLSFLKQMFGLVWRFCTGQLTLFKMGFGNTSIALGSSVSGPLPFGLIGERCETIGAKCGLKANKLYAQYFSAKRVLILY